MKAIILYLIAGTTTIGFCQESTWNREPFDIFWDNTFHKMTFRDPVVFTPFEIKIGYLYYGGADYWSGLPYDGSIPEEPPVILDSTQYQFNAINTIDNRRGLFVEVDFLRTNLPHFVFHQNYFDLQFGLGFHMTEFLSNPALPPDWNDESPRGDYYFRPKSKGLNFNTSLGWQLSTKRQTYFYHSLGIVSMTIYESDGGDLYLNGSGLSESFGLGTRYIIGNPGQRFGFSFGLETKWNRLYITDLDDPDNISPIQGLDLRASGLFFTFGIQFGGKRTSGDVGLSYMQDYDFITAAANFENFLEKYSRHGKREKAVEMLQYCQSQIPYQQVKQGVENIGEKDYDEAVEWLNAAEDGADEELREIINKRRNGIAIAFLDSVKNYKREMTITEAEAIALTARKLAPDLEYGKQVLAGLYVDKGNLNFSTGNYMLAIESYQTALELYPPMEKLVMDKYEKLVGAYMKDAYFAARDDELFLVLKSVQSIIELDPEMARDLDAVILKLENRIQELRNEKSRTIIQEFVKMKKQEALQDYSQGLRLGMNHDEVVNIRGKPDFIDYVDEHHIHYEMWTYPSDTTTTRLYFENELLMRIEE